jgi:hypothetical protein
MLTHAAAIVGASVEVLNTSRLAQASCHSGFQAMMSCYSFTGMQCMCVDCAQVANEPPSAGSNARKRLAIRQSRKGNVDHDGLLFFF